MSRYTLQVSQYQIIDYADGVIVDGPNHEVILRRDGCLIWHHREPPTGGMWPSTQLLPYVATEAVSSLLLLHHIDDEWRRWAQGENERMNRRPADPPVPSPDFLTNPSPFEPTKSTMNGGVEITIRGRDTYLILRSDGTIAWRWAPGALNTTLQPIEVSVEQKPLFEECVQRAMDTICAYIDMIAYRRKHTL